jgi:hypothetical protein
MDHRSVLEKIQVSVTKNVGRTDGKMKFSGDSQKPKKVS